MTKSSFKSETHTSKGILEIGHIDLCGSIEVKIYKGDKYIILLVDDYSRMMTIMFLKQKSNAFQMFKWYLERVEKETDAKSKEGIFLDYSRRSKAYECLNTNTKIFVESADVKFDEYIGVQEAEAMKEFEDYKIFVYFYEDMSDDEAVNQVVNQ